MNLFSHRSCASAFESQNDPISGTCTKYYLGQELAKVKVSYVMGDHGGSDEYFFKEASSSDASSMRAMLKKIENQTCMDQERGIRLMRHAKGASAVQNSGELGRLLSES